MFTLCFNVLRRISSTPLFSDLKRRGEATILHNWEGKPKQEKLVPLQSKTFAGMLVLLTWNKDNKKDVVSFGSQRSSKCWHVVTATGGLLA